jgi:hypothetical protein
VPALLQLLEMNDEVLEEAELRGLAMRPGRTRRQVNRDDPELAEARLDIAALGVELLAGEPSPDLIGRLAAHQCDAAIALFLGEGVAGGKSLQAVEPRVEIELLALDLLQAHHVGTLRREPAKQTLVGGRADAVHIDRDDAHQRCRPSAAGTRKVIAGT